MVYTQTITLFRSAAGVIAGFAGHFVIVVSVGEQQLRKRQALKEAEQTREAAGRPAGVRVARKAAAPVGYRSAMPGRMSGNLRGRRSAGLFAGLRN